MSGHKPPCREMAVPLGELQTAVNNLAGEVALLRKFKENFQGLGWKILAYGAGTIFVQVVIGVMLVGQVKAYMAQLGAVIPK